MKIMKKIAWHHNRIKNGDGALADRIRKESMDALFGGKDSADWRKFMRNFHSNDDQLKRLVGKDDLFMADAWGPLILAYLVGSGPCGGGTQLSMIMDMKIKMKDFLDKDVDSATQQDPLDPADKPVEIPNNLKRYFEDDIPVEIEAAESTTTSSEKVAETDNRQIEDEPS